MTFPKVKKAVFLVAGFGTRFLPISKAVPKHMLPIVDKPILQYLVEEAVEAGIEDVIFVTGRGKNAIEDHFDTSYELEQTLIGKGKTKLLAEVEGIAKLASFAYTRQAIPKGDGDAILHALPFISEEPVLVVFPDYYMPSENNSFKRLIKYYNETGHPIIATDEVPMDKTDQFGVIAFKETAKQDVVKVTQFVEKPKKGTAPSNMINLGNAIITPEILKMIAQSSSTVSDGELRIADTYIKYIEEGGELYALKANKSGFDCGNAIGLLKANIAMGLKRDDIKDELWEFLKEELKQEEMREHLLDILKEKVD
jgi:UTP--glucose-1-phosphate uridylyltransferase